MQDYISAIKSIVSELKEADLTDLNDPLVRKFYIGISLGCGVFISAYFYIKRATPNRTISLITNSYYPYFGHYFWYKKLLKNQFKDYEEAFSLIYPLKSKIIQFSSAFSSNQIYILDPLIMKTVFNNKYTQYIVSQHNSDNKQFYGELLGNGYLIYKYKKNMKYKLQLKLLNDILSNNNAQQYMFECTNYHSNKLMLKIEELRNDGNRIDIHTLIECFLFDLFLNIYTGNDFGFIQMYPKQMTFHKAFKNIIDKMDKRKYKTFWKLQRLFGIGEEKEIKKSLDIINKNILSMINIKEMKMESIQQNEASDLLAFLLKAKLTESEIRDIIINMMVSTIESTKLLILWTMYELSLNPSILKQIDVELDVFLQNETNINMDNIHDDENVYFALLDCCLFETLRLYPPVCKRKYIVNNNVYYKSNDDEFILNKNEEIIINGYIYGRCILIWGDNASIFDPNRFMNTNIISNNESFEYIPFGIESNRSCLGKYIGLMIAKVMMVELLKKYDYQTVNIEDTSYCMNHDMLRMKNPFLIKVYPRDFV